MSTPDIVEAHLQDIHITATKAEALADGNKPKTLRKFEVSDSMGLEEKKYLNSAKGLSVHVPNFRVMKGTMEFDVLKSSTILTLIKSSYAARTPIFVHVIEDGDADAGSRGFVYECVIGSYPKTLEGGALVSVTVELGINDFDPI